MQESTTADETSQFVHHEYSSNVETSQAGEGLVPQRLPPSEAQSGPIVKIIEWRAQTASKWDELRLIIDEEREARAVRKLARQHEEKPRKDAEVAAYLESEGL